MPVSQHGADYRYYPVGGPACHYARYRWVLFHCSDVSLLRSPAFVVNLIAGTLLIGAVAVAEDARNCVMHLAFGSYLAVVISAPGSDFYRCLPLLPAIPRTRIVSSGRFTRSQLRDPVANLAR